MQERIKKIRRHFEITQQAFADRLGIKRGAVANYEVGRNEPTDSVISLICREFNVNETWLRTGEGDMFVEMPEEDLYSRAAASLLKDDDALAIEGLKLYYSLRPEEKKAVTNYILRLADLIREHQSEQSEDMPAASTPVGEAEAEYIKSRSGNAQKEDSSVLNTTAGRKIVNQ